MRTTSWMLAGALALAWVSAAAEGDGSQGGGDQRAWAPWQGRLTLGSPAPWQLGADRPAQKLSGASLMGDYYFSSAPVGAGHLGGFRATSGLIFGPRSSLSIAAQPNLGSGSAFSVASRLYGLAPLPAAGDASGDASTTLPYLGFGYTGLSIRSGWSFSADLGMIAQGNAARLGRALGGNQSLDDAVRELRLAPMLQLGASYSF